MPESRKNPKPEKCFSKPQTPTNPLHALLAGFAPNTLIENHNHRHKTENIIARAFAIYKSRVFIAQLFSPTVASYLEIDLNLEQGL